MESNRSETLRKLEVRVCQAYCQRVKFGAGTALYTLEKGTPASSSVWWLCTPRGEFFGDSLEEVIQQAEAKGYADILFWPFVDWEVR